MKKIMFFISILALMTLIMTLISGCVSQPKTNNSETTSTITSTQENITSNKDVIIEIKNFAFSPESITVMQGTSVTWINSDSVAHTVTSTTGEFDSIIQPGSRFTYVFNTAGLHEYSCTVHPSMIHGKITVK